MEYTTEEEKIFANGRKIKEIRERCFHVCGPNPCDCPQEAKKLRQEIEAMGYLVKVEARVDLETLQPDIEVKIFKPKENLPPDLAEIYDDWLMQRRLEFDETKKTQEDKPMTDEEFLKKAKVSL